MKTRTDSWETQLPNQDVDPWRVFEQMRRHKASAVREWIREEYGIEPPSESSLYRFARRMRERESAHRIEQAVRERNAIRAEMHAVGDMDDELQFAWEQQAFDSALRGDAEGGQRFLAMALKLRESALEREKLSIKRQAEQRAAKHLKLDREKFEEQKRKNAEAREKLLQVSAAAKAGGLDDETIARIEEAAGLL